MDRASQSVMYGLWIVCLVGMATAIGIFSGWEANGWMGAATGGVVGYGGGALISQAPSLFFDLLFALLSD
ncbi:hypothetical protein B0E45_23530 [Sinorhizobium sp. A49]|uniref:hypothetical protein n=1 Tax=Sinorhizobium sp. A49 TaxID=1945861 RepID=UPI000986B17C|nr:hypothetical protein [Sinorhizobium sp. A49]OOG67617.1 hypothetical protein B0E45_23530 [Sinorhizobium sp. A49]